MSLVCDHSMPMLSIIIDFFVNGVPFVPRHFSIMAVFASIYMAINYTFTVTNGRPVYDIMNWKWPTGVLVPIATVVVAVCLFFLMTAVVRHKLKLFGFSHTQHKQMSALLSS